MLIHAFRRRQATPVHTGKTLIEFIPNEAGDVVAEVAGDADVALLLSIGEAYRAYLPAVASLPAAFPAPDMPASLALPGKAFVLRDGEQALDLAGLDDEQLRAFARDKGIRVHWRLAGDRIRQAIVDGLPELAEVGMLGKVG